MATVHVGANADPHPSIILVPPEGWPVPTEARRASSTPVRSCHGQPGAPRYPKCATSSSRNPSKATCLRCDGGPEWSGRFRQAPGNPSHDTDRHGIDELILAAMRDADPYRSLMRYVMVLTDAPDLPDPLVVEQVRRAGLATSSSRIDFAGARESRSPRALPGSSR
jgi:hypothetical protein